MGDMNWKLIVIAGALLLATSLRAAEFPIVAPAPGLPVVCDSPQGLVVSPGPLPIPRSSIAHNGSYLSPPTSPIAFPPVALGCTDCERNQPGSRHGKHDSYLHQLAGRCYFNWIEPLCGTDGCLSPIGCSNFHIEFVWLFGSCRQFFGTGTAAPPSLLPLPPQP
jgi:hypothetical protein